MSEKAPMQSTPFVSSIGETRNPIYEGQFEDETPDQAEARRHWAKVAMEMARNAALSAPNHSEQVREVVPDQALLSDVVMHLTDWLDLHECECENGHVCGRGHVRATRDKVQKLIAAAPSAGSQGGDV